ncbi:MAG: DUF2064 domain-containing protein [Deltaproteobacteria bacterium]|nr:DUF2064 domain-containing protein [Candidatus Tharpella sp.]
MSNVTLLLFTRYPRPGQTKTRLIPVLDADAKALASKTDLVFGPAHDGGYYLIGLNRVAGCSPVNPAVVVG